MKLSRSFFRVAFFLIVTVVLSSRAAEWSAGTLTLGPDVADQPRAFAVLLQTDHSSADPKAIDLAIVVDLSASQKAPALQQTLLAIERLVEGLQGGSRVQLILTHSQENKLPTSPAAVGSVELKGALAQLADQLPRGACSMTSIMKDMEAWNQDRSGSLVKRIVFAGDFANAIDDPTADELRRFESTLIATGTSISSLATEIERLPDTILRWIEKTDGGMANTIPDQNNSRAWGTSLSRPTLTELELETDDANPLIIPDRITHTHLRRGLLVLGKTNKLPLGLMVRGRRDGEIFRERILVDSSDALSDVSLPDLVSRLESFPSFLTSDPAPGDLDHLWARLATRARIWRKQALKAASLGQKEEAEHLLRQASQLDSKPAQLTDEPKTSTPVDEAKAKDQINRQKLTSDVNQSLDQARKLLRRDPAAAIDLLKRTLQGVAGIDNDTRTKLRARIESALRSASIERLRADSDYRARQQALAASDARRYSAAAEQSDEDRRRAILDRYRALLGEGDTATAKQVAEQVSTNDPSNLAAQAADLNGTLSDRYARIENIEFNKQRGFWDSLAAVEDSSIPIPDNHEIVFPDAARWEALTARRAKYKRVDLRQPSEAELKIERALSKPITVDFKETPLREVVDLMKEFAGSNVVLDLNGLDEAGVDADEPITLSLDEVPLKSVLKLLLNPLELDYIIRNDVLMITSQTSTEEQLETRVYPVADLVIPIANFNGGGVGLNGQVNTTQQGQAGPGGLNQPNRGDGLGNFQGPVGNNGNAVRRDISDDLKNILQQIDDRQADATKPNFWKNHFNSRVESGPALEAAVRQLVQQRRHAEVVAMLSAARQHQSVPSWTDEAELLSMSMMKTPHGTIEEAALSLIDRGKSDPAAWRRAARILGMVGKPDQAARLLRRQQERARPSVTLLFDTLLWGIDAEDVESVVWAADRILARPWPARDADPQEAARRQLVRFEKRLRDQNRVDQADRVRAVLQSPSENDLVVTLVWEGEADLDLSVIEPTRFYCTPLTPETMGGGILRADTPNREERYTVPQAIAGKYEIRVEKIWGEPTAGIANLDIVWNQGTREEKRERRTITWKDSAIAQSTVELDRGRRQTLSPAADHESFVLDTSSERPMAEFRRFLQANPTGGATAGGLVPFAIAQGAVAGGGAVAFDPVVTAIPDGVNLQAQAIVSADRRFVRMTLVPIVQSIESINDVRVFNAVGPAPTAP
jgi:hypothetical protein